MAAVAYYNEFDGYAAAWLRNLISAGHLPAGDVDERSIVDVAPSDLAGYTQCHFFAGIGGWPLAARLAGWPDDRELWTGSAPCQPFSVAGQQRGTDDDRHLWPHLFRLASARRPAVLMGEQVAAAVGKNWLDGIAADLEGIGYACGAVVVPAAAVDAPHRRDRLWFVADANGKRPQGPEPVDAEAMRRRSADPHCSRDCAMADTNIARASEERQQRSRQLGGAGGDPGACVGCGRSEFDCCGDPRPCVTCGKCWDDCICVLPGPFIGDVADADGFTGGQGRSINGGSDQGSRAQSWAGFGGGSGRSAWGEHAWLIGHDGKARRVGSDVRRVVDGLPRSLAGMCADFYAEAAEGVIGYATTKKCGPDEVLRAVRDIVAAEAVWQKPGGFHGVREAEILLPYLRELERRIDEGGLSGAVQEIAQAGVRGVRVSARSACSSQGWRLHEQRAGEYPDALHALSRLLARTARQAADPLLRDAKPMDLLAHGIEARVGKLRAFGNAIVPAVAAEVIGAYMDCRP